MSGDGVPFFATESGDACVAAEMRADWEPLLEQLWDASGGGVPLFATASGDAGVAVAIRF